MVVTDPYSVSAIIPAYNIATYIDRAIRSVLAQSSPVEEIIVVDDGSTDNTKKIVDSFGSKVRYIYQDNAGVAQARNRGVAQAKGNWIAFLDGDDEWLENHIEKSLLILQSHPELKWCCGNYYRQMAGDSVRREDMNEKTLRKFFRGRMFCNDYFFAYCHRAGGHTNTMVIEREALLATGGFRKIVSPAEDIDMWFRLGLQHPFGYVIEPTTVYYVERGGSLMTHHQTAHKLNVNARIIQDHYQAAKKLAKEKRFIPAGQAMARRVIRGALFEKELAPEIKEFLDNVAFLLPSWYVSMIQSALKVPRITAGILHCLSRLNRVLRFRKRIVPTPKH